jgi:quercetin dioxygenase-like cupin family protein
VHLIADWDEREFAEVRPGITAATVETEQLTVTLYRYGPGSAWEEHRHPEDQVTTVLEGAIEFSVEGRAVTLSAGQLVMLPGGVPHAANVPASGAISLNVWRHRG